MICPNCGSNNVTSQVVRETTIKENGKDYSPAKGCLGVILFNVPGLLCGFCGSGRKTKTTYRDEVIHVCQSCGRRF